MTFKTLPLIAAVSAMTLVAACDPYGPNGNQNARTGALLGAAAGAAAAGITNPDDNTVRERNQRILIGAAAGAAGGAVIGNQLDKQAEELRASLGNNVGVVNTGDQLVVTMANDILFATDSTTVSGAAAAELATVASSLNRYPNTTVNVVGHTDNVGSAAYNYDLSTRRAQSVASILAGNGVSSTRLRTVGRGEDQPVATNLTAEGRQMNRRVEIIITPM